MKPRLLLIGPLPRDGTAVGGTQVSFAELVERFRHGGAFDLCVIDTSRRGTYGPSATRIWRDLCTLALVLANLPAALGRCDAVMFCASSPAMLRAGPLVWLASRLAGRPLIVRPFGGNLDLALERAPRRRRALARRTILRAELVLLQTRALCARFEGAARTRWLPTTRSLEARRATPERACRRFLFLAQLRPEKGLADAVRAVEAAPAGCTLSVAGARLPSTDLGPLERSPRAHYLGALAPCDVPRVLAEHDALLLPTTYQGEGLPGVVVEALQAGLPVVATRWRSLPELVEHEISGLLVEPGVPAQLDAAVRRLAEDARLVSRLSSGALERGGQFLSAPWHARLETWIRELGHRGESKAPHSLANETRGSIQ